ncbi:MAG: hypothetical protein GY710_06315 [Desulfobacteraceae bacterium]|nr:hypothetical protein [Desulfobacteraceae bacterium]
MSDYIPGGYIIKAKCIEKSKIASAPPCTRETWNWLLLNANFKDSTGKSGHTVKRGQIFCRYKDILEGLTWFVGFKATTYSTSQMKATMKYLRDELMVTTRKHRQGVMITICNYDKYQTFTNYEQTNEQTNGDTTKHPTQEPDMSDIKEVSEVINVCANEFEKFWNLYDKKIDRKKCFAKWKRLKESDKEEIFKTLPNYLKSNSNKEFRKHPKTYLNNESWNDEIFDPLEEELKNNPHLEPLKLLDKPESLLRIDND